LDDLWEIVRPLLPWEPPKPKGGRLRVLDRACLTEIIFVLKTGLPWENLPQEAGRRGSLCFASPRDLFEARGFCQFLSGG
jgi:transposase